MTYFMMMVLGALVAALGELAWNEVTRTITERRVRRREARLPNPLLTLVSPVPASTPPAPTLTDEVKKWLTENATALRLFGWTASAGSKQVEIQSLDGSKEVHINFELSRYVSLHLWRNHEHERCELYYCNESNLTPSLRGLTQREASLVVLDAALKLLK